MPVKLYYEDSHLAKFTARVMTCGKTENGFAVTLDRTAFFPEGGGQNADTGVIGGARVLDAQEKDGEILHYTDAPLTLGEVYSCRIDWEQRFSRMQNHSGEHIVSGLVHKLYGYDNVGFHMGAECVTIDFNGELSGDDLAIVERLANEAVTKNLTVTAAFPTPDELAKTDYRSKKSYSVRFASSPSRAWTYAPAALRMWRARGDRDCEISRLNAAPGRRTHRHGLRWHGL